MKSARICATCNGAKGTPRPATHRATNTRRPQDGSWLVCDRCFRQGYRKAPDLEFTPLELDKAAVA